jgi:SAM-dependent methyltransferase
MQRAEPLSPVLDTGAYLYSNADPVALARLRGLEAIEDSATIELLMGLNIQPGWKCLELGAGAGSIAYWLAETLGKPENVHATDMDIGLLDAGRCSVQRHDVRKDPLPACSYDLVHFRHLLIHIPRAEHRSVLGRLLSATRPAGVLLAEESDLHTWKATTASSDEQEWAFNDGIKALHDIYERRGLDTAAGQSLVHLLADVGFCGISSTSRTWRVQGGTTEANFHVQSMRQLAQSSHDLFPQLAARVLSVARCCEDPSFEYQSRSTIAVIAHRPIDTP